MPAEAKDQEIANLQWKKRILLAIAPSAQDEKLAVQRRMVRDNGAGLLERDIAVFEFTGDDPRTRSIRKQFAVEEDRFKAVLIGKDGNTALTSDTPLSADKLFGTIDAMPMRKDEMRRQRR